MRPSIEHEAFYDHKRAAHGGDYSAGCDTCRLLWRELVSASERKAGVTPQPSAT